MSSCRATNANAVPRETQDYLKGFREGAEYIFEEIEKASKEAA